jgi:ribonuclease HI
MNNIAKYEALINEPRITSEVGARWLLVRGDSKMVVDQVMKAMEPCDMRMFAYYNEVHELEEKIKGFKLHHSYRRFNAEADKLSTIASGRKPVPDGVFASDLYEPSMKSSKQRDK